MNPNTLLSVLIAFGLLLSCLWYAVPWYLLLPAWMPFPGPQAFLIGMFMYAAGGVGLYILVRRDHARRDQWMMLAGRLHEARTGLRRQVERALGSALEARTRLNLAWCEYYLGHTSDIEAQLEPIDVYQLGGSLHAEFFLLFGLVALLKKEDPRITRRYLESAGRSSARKQPFDLYQLWLAVDTKQTDVARGCLEAWENKRASTWSSSPLGRAEIAFVLGQYFLLSGDLKRAEMHFKTASLGPHECWHVQQAVPYLERVREALSA